MSGFTPSYTGLGELLVSTGMQNHMRGRAERIAEAARADAPIGPADDPHRGLYRDSFEVTSGVRGGAKPRAYGRVENTAPYAVDVELGNSRQAAHHTLLRAVDAARD